VGLSPHRTVAELRELQELTGNENGAQRVAWTETWERARQWLREKVVPTGADEEIDQAGNQWFTLPGASERALLLGGHIDSVPNGGWLDGCLNILAGVEVLRRIAEILGTFVLMWAIMGVAVNPRGQRDWAGLVIGITLGFAVMAFAPISGAGFNPARWFGPAVVGSEWGNWLIYIVGPIIGGLLAGFVYDRVVIVPENKVTKRPIDTLG